MSRPRVLCIAGSDSSGGAGIQADVRTALALGAHAMTVVTAVTAQNSVEVRAVRSMGAALISLQIEEVLADIGADAVKVGLLADAESVHAVANLLESLSVPIVVDPVTRASTTDAMQARDAEPAYRARILPLATVLTPNHDEAKDLCGKADARAVQALGPAWVLLTGGATAVDVLDDGTTTIELVGEPVATRHGHGTGCTLSTALAVRLAAGDDVPTAARAAKDYVSGALRGAYELGSGPGPLDHAWRWSGT